MLMENGFLLNEKCKPEHNPGPGCICPKCKEELPGKEGTSCNEMTCPKCKEKMMCKKEYAKMNKK